MHSPAARLPNWVLRCAHSSRTRSCRPWQPNPHQHHHYPRSIIDITRDGGRPGQRIAGRPLTVGPLVRVGDREGPADAALGTKRIQVRPVPGRFSATRE